MATNDVRKRDKNIEAILLNREVIAINQDPWGLPAFRINNTGGCVGEMWARHLANSDVAVLILNRGSATTHTRLDFSDFLKKERSGGVSVSISTSTSISSGSYHVRDMQNQKDIGVFCEHVGFTLEAHQTAFVRLHKIADTCTPTPLPACSPPPPAPPTPPPTHAGGCPNGPCKSCLNSHIPCPGVPPLPPCPAGYTSHISGYWANPDQTPGSNAGVSVVGCGAQCDKKKGCVGFEVYDPAQVTEPSSRGGSSCFTFTSKLKMPFTDDERGLIRTCVKG